MIFCLIVDANIDVDEVELDLVEVEIAEVVEVELDVDEVAMVFVTSVVSITRLIVLWILVTAASEMR